MKKVLIIGSVHTEIDSQVETLTENTEDMNFLSQKQTISGSGYKAALLFQNMGFPYILAAASGTGVYGDFVKKETEKRQIQLSGISEETAGCSYRLFDQSGGKGHFTVAGGEYAFHTDYLKSVDPEEISHVIVFSDMLAGDDADTIINVLEQIEVPIHFVISDRGDEMTIETLLSLYALNPFIYTEESLAYDLIEEEYESLDETAGGISSYTFAPVMIASEKEGIYYCDRNESFRIAERNHLDADILAAASVLAKNAGVDLKNSIYFAADTAEKWNIEIDEEQFYAERKRSLTGLITLK